MAKFDKFKLNRNSIKGNLEKVQNYISAEVEVKVYNETELLNNSSNRYVSLDFKFPTLFIFGNNSTSHIYSYIAEYANKHSVNIVSISEIKRDESDKPNVTVIFERINI